MTSTRSWGRGTAVVLVACALVACGGGDQPADAGGVDAGAQVDAHAVDAARSCERLADCDDGLFCNGAETCVDTVCAAGTPPCDASGELCMEDADRCVTVDCSTNASADVDGDGHRSMACDGDDCDDTDPNRYPGNDEVCDSAGHDEDCEPRTFGFRDLDMDGDPDALCCNGATCGTDCDDSRPGVNTTVPEVCGNGLDDNCDGRMDEGLLVDGFADADGDGWGDDSVAVTGVCPGTPGFAARGGDCDESDPAINPGATEACDTIDNDCDDAVDDGLPTVRCYADSDGDGFGTGSTYVELCACPAGFAPNNSDCQDGIPGAASIFPGQTGYFIAPIVIHNLDGTTSYSWDYNCDGRDTPAPCGCGALCHDGSAPQCPLSTTACGSYVPYVTCHADCSAPEPDGTYGRPPCH